MSITNLMRRFRGIVVYGSIALCVLGMILVIAGVLTSGLFLPGVVMIGLGLIGFAKAAVFEAVLRRQPE